MAIPVAGPTPGNMPTSVPRKLPIVTHIRFCKESAPCRPRSRLEKISVIAAPSERQNAAGQTDLEQHEKDEIGRHGKHQSDGEIQ